MPRPRHPVVVDETGLTKSMPAAREQFERHVHGRPDEAPVVFLGLGPEPENLSAWFELNGTGTVYYLESQNFADQMSNGWEARVPDNFERIEPERFTCAMAGACQVIRYLPVQRAFPSFYTPLAARLALATCSPGEPRRAVWLPGTEADLLMGELESAFAGAGFAVDRPDPEPLERSPGSALPPRLQEYVPALFFSVNLKGLDPFGLGYRLLRETGCRVAVWLVDNPLHQLTSMKSDFWRGADLLVTDASFIPLLRDLGARHVHHLPLGASPELLAGGCLPEHGAGLEGRPVYVGRSSFPDRDKYFAGLAPDQGLLAQALAMLERGQRPDYHWWHRQLGDAPLWPGNAVRAVGCGAEAAGRAWKEMCLAGLGADLVIFGDQGWQENLGAADLRGVVDYYAHLPAVYRAAGCVVNVTSMQLPAGLTQRHFDVWGAGGFLVSDSHAGLDIFPPELVRAVTFDRPSDLPGMVRRFAGGSAHKRELAQAWQGEILANHTYAARVKAVLAALDMG